MLKTDGYVYITGVAPEVDSEPFAAEICQRHPGFEIFNRLGRGVDPGFRRQFQVAHRGTLNLAVTNDFPWMSVVNSRIEVLASNLGRRVASVSGLISHAGCQEQPSHCDFDPKLYAGVPMSPLGVLVATQSLTSLMRRHLGAMSRVDIHRGDAVLFRADFIHAGSAYKSLNFRMHAYLDTEEFVAPMGHTFLVDLPVAETSARFPRSCKKE